MRFLFLLISLFSLPLLAYDKPEHVIYLHPRPNSRHISTQTQLLLKVAPEPSHRLVASDFTFTVQGEKSGSHSGQTIVSDNTIIFKPSEPFLPAEKIDVTLKIKRDDQGQPFRYAFFTNDAIDIPDLRPSTLDESDAALLLSKKKIANQTYGALSMINGVAVPGDFPRFNFDVLKDDVAPGKIFIQNWIGSPYIIIFENDGTPYAYQRVEERARDFKVQLNGQLTRRYRADLHCFVGLDNQFAITDTFRCTNGFGTDEHELQITEDDHYFLIALGGHREDMSKLVAGGDPNAWLLDNHVQEFDEHGNLVFEWLCTDHFDVRDAVHENLTGGRIDYVHMNSIGIDNDGHIIISSRHLSEVTKIHRHTGEIIWRLGGENNQFEFLNTSHQISYQHDARPVPGKPDHYTVFDNGNFHNPRFSRAVEFALDTGAKTATMVWEYRFPDGATGWMGNAQRLPNGNTYINWADGSLPKATEVTANGEVVYQGNFVDYTHTYRAFRFDWNHVFGAPQLLVESLPDRVTLIYNKFGDKNIKNYLVYGGTSRQNMSHLATTTVPYLELNDLQDNTFYYFKVQTESNEGVKSDFSNIAEAFVKFTKPGQNMIVNGDFSQGDSGWDFLARDEAVGSGGIEDGAFHVQIDEGGDSYWKVQLIQEEFPIIQGRKYLFEFDARADGNRLMEPRVAQNGGSFTVYSKTSPIALRRQMQHFAFEFIMTDATDYKARVVLNCGTSNIDCYFDNVAVTEIVESSVKGENTLPNDYQLLQNFPNPFNPKTHLTYNVPELSVVSIKVFNVLGEQVSEIINKPHETGVHQIAFDAADLSSGIYFYSMQADAVYSSNSFFDIKKMMLVK